MKKFLFVLIAALMLVVPNINAQTSRPFTLTWTAPSDNVGVVTYEIRYSTDSTALAGRTGATLLTNSMVPKAPGQPESFTFSLLLNDNVRVGFAVWSLDAAGNRSLISNIKFKTTTDTTPPSSINDLQVL